MGWNNGCIFLLISSCCLGKKWILNKKINKIKKIMKEILIVGITCFLITLFGLALGFLFLQIQATS